MLTSIDVKFPCGLKGCFCPADILQIVMWSKELYSCCSCYVLGSSSPTSSSQNG